MSRKASTAGSSTEGGQQPNLNPSEKKKRKTRPAGHPDPLAEVVALQPDDLLAIGQFVCYVCGKGFQRDQNLLLHMRTHNVNWELRKSSGMPARRKAYVCPIPTCVYHDRSHALSDITGIKKHFNRKHGPKNLHCPHCTKHYAVEADLKAHIKTHSLPRHQCDCGRAFAAKNSYQVHRAFCGRLSKEGMKLPASATVGESSSSAAKGVSFDNRFMLPDMNEHAATYAEVPQSGTNMVEQQPSESLPVMANYNQDDPATHERMNRIMASLPDDPNFITKIPMCLTDLLMARYEILDEFCGSRVVSGSVTSPHSGTSQSILLPPASSLDGLMGERRLNEKSSAVDLFEGSSSSFMVPIEESPGFGMKNLNMCANETGDETSLQANSTLSNNLLGNPSAMYGQNISLSASLLGAGKGSYYTEPYKAPALPESSTAIALSPNAAFMGATLSTPSSTYFSGPVMKTPANFFEVPPQEHSLPQATAPSFLTLMTNQKPEPVKPNPLNYPLQQLGYRRRSAFSIYHQASGNISSNNSSAPSFFLNNVENYSMRKGKAPAGLVDYFSSSAMVQEIPLPGNPRQPLMDSYVMSNHIGPSNGGMVEENGWKILSQAESMSMHPDLAPPEMVRPSREEAIGDGVTMDLLGICIKGEGIGQLRQEGANPMLAENNGDGEDQMGIFFGGMEGYRSFW
ncbi:hypothetical protein ZIOFF_052150 [Zingiber officinale]|uniref:C2H2-type domain-containing protein n=1 Tax=Zingiber officinale TaxID=94328 RepID=A0A8J5FU06_ZINOF|nr:hypothetical protein ZIOFF_052150 [Zingiber officinale]